MAMTAQSLVEDIGALVSLPEVVRDINKMVNEIHADAADISRLISQDPGLAIRLLKFANSQLGADMPQIDSVDRAVRVLDIKQIRDIVSSATVAKVFDGIPSDLVSIADFWHHSLYSALLARDLAERSNQVNADTLFTAGLLHDIGHLIMFNRIPREELEAIMLTIQAEVSRDLIDAEQELLGFDHTEVGLSLAQQWRLPDVITECIAHHHQPLQASRHASAVALIHIANAIASAPYGSLPVAEDLKRIEPKAWGMAGLEVADVKGAVQSALARIGEIQQALFGEIPE